MKFFFPKQSLTCYCYSKFHSFYSFFSQQVMIIASQVNDYFFIFTETAMKSFTSAIDLTKNWCRQG